MALEIERRFLIKNDNWKEFITKKIYIEQGYLSKSLDGWITRIRCTGNNSKITPIIQKYAPEIEAYFRELIDNRNVVEEALEIIEPLKQEVVPEPISEDTKDGDS